MYIVGQVVGFIYLFFLVLSFQFKEKENMIVTRVSSAITASIHYLLIGAITGALAQLNNAIVTLLAAKLMHKELTIKIISIIIFSMVYIAIAIYGYKNPSDVLPSIGFILTTIVVLLANTRQIRLAQFAISPLFLIYNIVNHSYAGIITETIVLLSCVMGILRLDLKWKNKKSKS